LADFFNVKVGLVSGVTFTPGVYTWDSYVSIPANSAIYIKGTATDIFIFQISSYLSIGAYSMSLLVNDKSIANGPGCSKASNIFWQVTTYVDVGAGSHLTGVLLAKTSVNFGAWASLNGRILA
jgi:hypothetical protein